MIADCTALILAGGDSRRMGQDKAMLDLAGSSLLEHVTATMRGLFPELRLSVRQPRASEETTQVCDEPGQTGPLAGLIAGMAQVKTPWVFAVACDMPFMVPALVQAMAALRGTHQAVVPLVGGHPQPLAAFYAVSALPLMRASLASGDNSLRGMLRHLDVHYVAEDTLRGYDAQLRSFFDLDTPQDVAMAKEWK